MAKYSVPVNITVPDSIDLRLLREDVLDTSNIFRILFEISLALFAAVIGAYIPMEGLGFVHFLLLAVLGILSVIFLTFWICYYNKAKVKEISSEDKTEELPFKISGFMANIRLEDKTKVASILEKLELHANQIQWRSNTIKTDYQTLKITKLSNEIASNLVDRMKSQQVDYIDDKLILQS